MVRLIDKYAISAELEKRLNYRVESLKSINDGTFWDEDQSEDEFNKSLTICAFNAVRNELFELKCFLDTLEVKEVNFEQEVTLKQIEEAIEKVGLPEYPKCLEGGLWKLSENCITGQKGYEEFMEKFKEEQKKDNEKILNDPSMVKIVDLNGMNITFSDSSDK